MTYTVNVREVKATQHDDGRIELRAQAAESMAVMRARQNGASFIEARDAGRKAYAEYKAKWGMDA